VCGWAGRSLLPILKSLGPADQDFIDYAAENRGDKAEATKVYEKVRLPGEFRPLCVPWGSLYYRQAIGYLADRGITSDDILTYKLGYCETGRYAERIIIPSFDEYGELNFFVGRAIWKRQGLPYLSGVFEKNIIFNDLLIDWTRNVVLVEGPFDAIKAGTNAIPLQGKIVSQKLLDKIIEKKAKVSVALDKDASDVALNIAKNLLSLGVEVSVVRWDVIPFDDPGEMTQAQMSEAIRTARKIHSVADLMVMRVRNSSSLENR
jgi:DNA primase